MTGHLSGNSETKNKKEVEDGGAGVEWRTRIENVRVWNKNVWTNIKVTKFIVIYRVSFLTGPAQKISKYGTGPIQ